jgi:membrane protein DedA with SNARE-associated domain
MFHQFVVWLADTVGQWGYPGIVLLMTLESSFFPFPSEIIILPAAYLAAAGKMDFSLIILSGTLGSLLGASFNYWLAICFGRPFLEKYGRYLLIRPELLSKADTFFQRYGRISTFIGRLLPGIRQYVSLPAGLARMNFPMFCVATGLGAGVWVLVLACIGYWFGHNEELVLANLRYVSAVSIVGCLIVIVILLLRKKKAATGTDQP